MTPERLRERITEYLSSGGLFNPELMDPEAVRDLIIDARDEITRLKAEITGAYERAEQAAAGPVLETNQRTGEPSLRGNLNGGNWTVPQPIAGYRGSDYGEGRYDAAAAIRKLGETL
jgi:hypothetical protein